MKNGHKFTTTSTNNFFWWQIENMSDVFKLWSEKLFALVVANMRPFLLTVHLRWQR